MCFIKASLISEKFFLKAKLSLLGFLFLVISSFLTCCNTAPTLPASEHTFTLSEEERTWLREFFRDLLFKHPGAYTLFGTKPISTSCIYHFSEEDKREMEEYYKNLSDEERMKLRKKRYNYNANYEKWQKLKSQLHIKQYLFGSFPLSLDESVEVVLFVNIEETLRVLLKYYADFQCVLGYDFNPLEVVFEVEDKNSEFWKIVMQNHALQGILLGFGQDNAWFFEWEAKYKNEKNKKGEFLSSLSARFIENTDIENYSPQNLLLPAFISYGLHPNKQLIEKYKKEQKQIRSLYKGKDEVQLALDWLTR